MLEKHSIQIVLVLYKTKIEDSLTYKTLCENISTLSCNHEFLVYNNSPEQTIENKNNYELVNATTNNMLVGPYNYALQRAIECKHNWLLLLDQDTCLTKEYFEQLNIALGMNKDVAAIIPKLQNKEFHLSPTSYNSLFGPWLKMHNIYNAGFIKNKTIQAFNSAALISVKALDEIGRFSLEFPLDQLDFYVFNRLSNSGFSFYLMNVTLSHDLAVRDYKNKMSSERYISILSSEYRFSKLLGIISVITYKLKLILRLLKQILTREKRPYSFITFKYLWKID